MRSAIYVGMLLLAMSNSKEKNTPNTEGSIIGLMFVMFVLMDAYELIK